MKKFLVALLCLFLLDCTYVKAEEEEVNTYACRLIDTYDYTKAVPASNWATDDYFDYVFMAGDSRMGTIRLLGSIPYKHMFYIDSLTIAKFGITKYTDPLGDLRAERESQEFESEEPVENDESQETLMSLVMKTDMPCIYLMLGINELGFSTETNLNSYKVLIEAVKETHPTADIYIFLLYTPEHTYGLNTYQAMALTAEWNEALKQLCADERVFFLDLDEVVANDQGYLKDEFQRGDGVHFSPAGARMASDYIREHVAWRDIYVKEICE